jgi:hypothetical protein
MALPKKAKPTTIATRRQPSRIAKEKRSRSSTSSSSAAQSRPSSPAIAPEVTPELRIFRDFGETSEGIELAAASYSTTSTSTQDLESTEDGNALTEFHLFPKLPTELRLRTWGYASPPPHVFIRRSIYDPSPEYLRRRGAYIRPVPAILQVNQECRAEFTHRDGANKNHPTYKLCFGFTQYNEKKGVWVSIEHDYMLVRDTG